MLGSGRPAPGAVVLQYQRNRTPAAPTFTNKRGPSMPSFPPGASAKGGRAGAEAHWRNAELEYAPLYPVVLELRRRGLSLAAIAAELVRRGYKSRQGYTHWSPTQVARVLRRAEAQ